MVSTVEAENIESWCGNHLNVAINLEFVNLSFELVLDDLNRRDYVMCVKMIISAGMLGSLSLSGCAQKLDDVDVFDLKPICQVVAVGREQRGGTLTISGETLQEEGATNNLRAALLTIRFLDELGNCCGVGGLHKTKAISTQPGYLYLPALNRAERFEQQVLIPTNAINAEIGFCRWSSSQPLRIRDIRCVMDSPLENAVVVRMLGRCVRHYRVSATVIAVGICLLLILFWCQYKSNKSVTRWFDIVELSSFLLVGFALVFGVTDCVWGLLIIFIFGAAIVFLNRFAVFSARDVLVAIFSIGIVLRLVALFSIEMTPYSDYMYFWGQIVKWSKFEFVGTKSYPMVALYSLLIRLFGEKYVVIGLANVLMGASQMLLAKEVAQCIFKSRWSGAFASAMIGLNPVLIIMTPAVASEMLYGTFILFSFWLFLELYEGIAVFSKSKIICLSLFSGLVAMLTLFTRGNGAGVVLLGVCLIGFHALRLRQFLKTIKYVFIPFCLICVIMTCIMCAITAKTIGYVCPTGSNWQGWVYLQGSNIEYKGNGTVPDHDLIMDLYSKKYPGKPFRQKAADPIIMSVFKNRWIANTAGEIALSLRKHCWVLRAGGEWAYYMNDRKQASQRMLKDFLSQGVHILRSALILAFVLGVVWLYVKRKTDCIEPLFLVAGFFLFNVFITFITVWTPRYSYTLWLILPILAASIMPFFEWCEKCVQSKWALYRKSDNENQ